MFVIKLTHEIIIYLTQPNRLNHSVYSFIRVFQKFAIKDSQNSRFSMTRDYRTQSFESQSGSMAFFAIIKCVLYAYSTVSFEAASSQ